jgi:superfamily II DNA or RNA helicase/ribosomal protein L40E
LGAIFKTEYGIDVEVDLVAARNEETSNRYYYQGYKPKKEPLLMTVAPDDPTIEAQVLTAWKGVIADEHYSPRHYGQAITIPVLDNLITLDPEPSRLEILAGGFRATPLDSAMMDFLEENLKIYNPVIGKPTGLKTSYLDPPALFKRGAEPAVSILSGLGFGATLTPAAAAKIEQQRERFRVLSIPLYPPKDHQRLAYFEEKEYTARQDVFDWQEEGEYRQDHKDNGRYKVAESCYPQIDRFFDDPCFETWDKITGLAIGAHQTIWQAILEIDPSFPRQGRSTDMKGKIVREWEKIPSPEMVRNLVTHQPALLFKKGKAYTLRPTWTRNKELVGVEVVGEGKEQKTITTEIDRGYLTIQIETEKGPRDFREPEPTEIAALCEAFDLPEVRDIAEERPELVKMWKKKLLDKYPHIFTQEFDYQAEDLARILSKMKSAYLGYDLGGGKTVAAMAFMGVREVKRVLVICQSSLVENWLNEARKFGFQAFKLMSHEDVDLLQWEVRNGVKRQHTTFFITSYEFLSLDTGRVYDPWNCVKYDKKGNMIHEVHGNRGRTCRECSREFPFLTTACPKCEEKELWSGNQCRKCGYSAFTYSTKEGIHQYPAYRRIKNLFRGVICDESQQAKSKTSFRGQAVRSIRAPSRLILTGTLMKGYITDTFYNVGFITRHNNPLFPYRFDRRGSKMFAEEFSTFEFKDIQYEDTLHKGRRKELPEVSNLNRFWRLLGAFTIRRLKDEMVKLPPKTRRILAVTPSSAHAGIYAGVYADAREKIDRELRKPQEEINMGVISKAIWAMRFAATSPDIPTEANAKIQKAVAIAKDAREKGDKVLIYSALREMQAKISREMTRQGVNHAFIPSTVPTKDRFRKIKEFSANPDMTAIVAGLNVLNRGWTITTANHVVFTDVEFSPEATEQAEGRAHRTGQEKPVTCHYLLMDWENEKENIDFKMFDLITAKQQAISNAIDGKVRYTGTARVLGAGGDFMAIARALTSKVADPLGFEYEKDGQPQPQAGEPEKVFHPAQQNDLWDKLHEEKPKHDPRRVGPVDINQISLF